MDTRQCLNDIVMRIRYLTLRIQSSLGDMFSRSMEHL